MRKTSYIPRRGDIIWLNFDPSLGHEQKGRRPALVVTPYKNNANTNLCIVCPVTSRVKGYAFEVAYTGLVTKGAVLVNQIKTIDIKSRNIEYAEALDNEKMDEISQYLKLLLLGVGK